MFRVDVLVLEKRASCLGVVQSKAAPSQVS